MPKNRKDARFSGPVLAAGFVFIAVGFGVAAWAALVPYVKIRLGIDEQVLGLLLLCIGGGALCAMPCAGSLAGRFGCRSILYVCIPVFFLMIVAAALAPTPLTLGLCLFLVGMASGTLDVVMNIQAVFLEAEHQRSMMSGFHGMYSLGGVVGAGGMGLLLGAGLPPEQAAGLLGGTSCLLMLCFFGRYFNTQRVEQGPTRFFVLPRGPVLVLGLLCLVLYMSEGVILDWGGLFMTSTHATTPANAAHVYAVFSIAITLGRLFGGRMVLLWGIRNLLVYGGIVASCGYALVLFSPSDWGSYLGVAVLGLGAANLIPLLFSLVSRQKVMPVNLAVAAATTVGFSGLLIGPAVMGFVAHATSLTVVFGIVAVLMLLVSAVSLRMRID